ncbi:hypothetical protein ACQP1G_29755 [Nocardia sp. CA-107356]|uniref:hypothetical protein n=1 Tax=Nocardia sp. CA-107356 TaxID=3239972 RepID=UPI003D94BE39
MLDEDARGVGGVEAGAGGAGTDTYTELGELAVEDVGLVAVVGVLGREVLVAVYRVVGVVAGGGRGGGCSAADGLLDPSG